MRIVGLVLMLSLVGCQQKVEAQPQQGVRGAVGSPGLHVIIDPNTGCEYLALYAHGITPRMTKEGGNYHHKGCR